MVEDKNESKTKDQSDKGRRLESKDSKEREIVISRY
jgi:hypothetical protein